MTKILLFLMVILGTVCFSCNGGSSPTSSGSTRCLGKTQQGNRCERMTTDASGYCWQHK